MTPAAAGAVIATERLDLVPLGPRVLRSIDRDDIGSVRRALGAEVPQGWMRTIPARLRLDQLRSDRSEQPWLVRAVVLRDPRRVVGHVGFHEPPDAGGRIEIGYEVAEADRRRGYAREAVLGLTAWAHGTGAARTCIASVSPGNTASLGLVASLGFREIGMHMDRHDGLEVVFEARLPLLA